MSQYPHIFRVRQSFESPTLPVKDIPATIEAELSRLKLREVVKPGQTVAITAGSRGVANIALIIKAVMGLRVEDDSEAAGVDEGEHAESGYDFSSLRSGGSFGSSHSTLSAPTQVTATAGKEG